ncbi:Ligand of Numb protein X 2 [Penaeus vannamei]|uniref:Ligand of Numb protein X 2 n=1 Tax=Penaeus vannamei TaxID=6689 RepID=A0A3R7QVM0_PENVA|nr:Ligand of Numb protein X 2 [Penaeus vannamei]
MLLAPCSRRASRGTLPQRTCTLPPSYLNSYGTRHAPPSYMGVMAQSSRASLFVPPLNSSLVSSQLFAAQSYIRDTLPLHHQPDSTQPGTPPSQSLSSLLPHPTLPLFLYHPDSPRCVVVQEVFPDGLVAQDGRLQPGDQIIEVDGVDMTSATHQAVCQSLRRPQAVLRLGVYRERIEAYRTASPQSSTGAPHQGEMVAVTLRKESSRQLGLKLGGRRTEPGIFVMEVLDGSVAAQDGRLHPHDRILAINGVDVRYARLDHASRLIQQSAAHVGLVVSRGAVAFVSACDAPSPECQRPPSAAWRPPSATPDADCRASLDRASASDSGCGAMEYGRSPSCDSLSDHSLVSSMMSSPGARLPSEGGGGGGSPPRGGSPATSSPGYCTSDTDDIEPHPSHPPMPPAPHPHASAPAPPPAPPAAAAPPHQHRPHPQPPPEAPTTPIQPAPTTASRRPRSTSTRPPTRTRRRPRPPAPPARPTTSPTSWPASSAPCTRRRSRCSRRTSPSRRRPTRAWACASEGRVQQRGDTPIYIANINPQGPGQM